MPFTLDYDAPPPLTQSDLTTYAEYCFGCEMWHHQNGESYRVNGYGEVVLAGSIDDDYGEDDYEDDYDEDYGSSHINSYGYKPRPVFHGDDSPVHLGMEVELECDGSVRDAAEVAVSGLGDVAYLKEDGSISCGFETVTHPMTYRWALDNFPWDTFRAMRDEGMYADSSTGIHVHVSRKAFTDGMHMFRWIRFIHRNESMIVHVAGRGSVGYASWPQDGPYSEKAKAKDYAFFGDRSSDRYTVLNMQNRATIEFRGFASTTDPDTLKARFGLIDASVEYTRTLTTRAIASEGGWDSDAFIAWLNEQPHYAPLADALASF